MHKCFDEIEKAANGQKIPTAFMMGESTLEHKHVFTLEREEPKQRGRKAMLIVMSHCPLCGASLQEGQSDVAKI